MSELCYLLSREPGERDKKIRVILNGLTGNAIRMVENGARLHWLYTGHPFLRHFTSYYGMPA